MKDDWYTNNLARIQVCAIIHSRVIRAINFKIYSILITNRTKSNQTSNVEPFFK